MTRIDVGDKLRLPISGAVGWLTNHEESMYTGKVIYVNAPHRYFTVEFPLPGGLVRESYKYSKRKDADGHVEMHIW